MKRYFQTNIRKQNEVNNMLRAKLEYANDQNEGVNSIVVLSAIQ